jgi:hypothetical protein
LLPPESKGYVCEATFIRQFENVSHTPAEIYVYYLNLEKRKGFISSPASVGEYTSLLLPL